MPLRLSAILSGVLLAGSIAPASAQSAPETVAFIVMLQKKGAKDFRGQTKYRFEASGDKLVVTDLGWIGGAQVYTYTQENACRFHLVGGPANNGFNKYDLTIDFTTANLDRLHSHREQNAFNATGSTLILTIPDVRVCRAKDSSGLMWSDVDQGKCADQLDVDVYNPQNAGRMVNALKYLRQNSCKGSPF